MNFKHQPLFKRIKSFKNITKTHPNKTPLIMIPNNSIKLNKHKYLISNELNISEFIYVLRKHIEITENEGCYLLFGDSKSLEPAFKNIRDVYNNHKSKDGFLYCQVVKESVFG